MVRVDETQIRAIRDSIAAQFPDDDALLADMLEGETDAADVLDALIRRKQEADSLAAAIKMHRQEMAERQARMERRADAAKEAMMKLLELCDLRKWERPLGTVSIGHRKPKRIVADETAIPDEFVKWERKIDRAALSEADGDIPGTRFDNGSAYVTVRTK